MNTYLAGNVIAFSATFTTGGTVSQGGSLVDPSTVEFLYEIASSYGSQVKISYAGASAPAVSVVSRTSLGLYVTWVDTTNFPSGELVGVWNSTGTGQARGVWPVLIQAPPYVVT